MKKKNLLVAVTVSMLSLPIFAEPAAPTPALPDGGVDLNLTFATNYVWRGADIYANNYKQKGEMYGSFNTPGAFQPSLTFKTAVDGLTFSIWGSFAMSGRHDRDIDTRYQRGPGASSILTTGDVVLDVNTSLAANALPTSIGGYETSACAANVGASTADLKTGVVTAGSAAPNCGPGFYKEEVGLKRLDEVDFTLAYSTETKKGVVGMGVINYVNPGTVGKAPFGAITEVYVSYAFPFFKDLAFTAFSGIDGVQEQYYQALYKKTIVENKTVKLEGSLGAGYKVKNGLQGWNDVTGALSVTVSGITIAVNVANRPDLRFFDGDTNTKLPMWADGTSGSGDGLVEDPSKSQGLFNDIVNATLTSALYPGTTTSYVPRSKLPHNIVWLTAGYTYSF